MTTVPEVKKYKTNDTELTQFLNPKLSYDYGTIDTGYKQDGIDIGNILVPATFSTVPNTILPCGYKTRILQYNTGESNTWSTVHTFPSAITSICSICTSSSGKYCIAVFGSSADIGHIYYSTNYGVNWNKTETTNVYFNGHCVAISADGTHAIVTGSVNAGGDRYVYVSNNYGKTWTQKTFLNQQYAISQIILSDYFNAVIIPNQDPHKIYFSVDGNNFYSFTAPPSPFRIRMARISSKGDICVGFNSPGAGNYENVSMYRSYDGGNIWEKQQLNIGINTISMSMSASGQYIVVSTDTGVHYSSDYGVTFTKSNTTIPGSYFYLLTMSATGQYVLSNNGSFYSYQTDNINSIYRSSDYGKTWASFITPIERVNSLCMSKDGLYAFGIISNKIFRSVNTSTTKSIEKDLTEVFEPMYQYFNWAESSSINGTWRSVSMSLNGKYALACIGGPVENVFTDNDRIFYSSNYGQTWTRSNSPIANWNSVAVSSSGQYCIACVSVTNSPLLTNADYKIHYSSNYGQTWTRSNSLAGPWTKVAISGSGKNAVASTLTSTLSGSTAKLYYSNNYGASWIASNSIAGLWNSIAMSQDGFMVIATNNNMGRIYCSGNFGADWIQSNSVYAEWNAIATSASGQFCIVAPKTGQIYRSTNFGIDWTVSNSISAQWNSLSLSLDGQYCIAAPKTGQIYFSSDYGRNWNISESLTSTNWSSVAISGSGQYALGCINNNTTGKIYCCKATN
jgi:photosystem II stability/assembly factor-like uncharacterized protein